MKYFIFILAFVSVFGSCNKTQTVQLDGSKSFDPDGTIVSFHWRQIAGPSSVTIADPGKEITTVSGLPIIGIYVFELSGTDNNGATRKDTVIKNITK